MPDTNQTGVNSQVVDSINITNERVLGDVVAHSHGVALESFGHAISLLMLNAVTTQNASAQLANAAVVSACSEILNAGALAANSGPVSANAGQDK